MKAAVLHSVGSLSDNISLEEVDMPIAGDDDVIIKVHSASLNHRDLWIAMGKYAKIKLPVIPGSDCAGTIHSKGRNVSAFNEGDEVIVNPSFDWGDSESHQSDKYSILGMPENGTLAEYVKVNASNVYRKPQHLTFEEASALPLAGVTAYRALFVRGDLKPGMNVLITGIGGAVASLALTSAVAAGANVFVTSGSFDKVERSIELGAKGGALYSDEDWNVKLLELTGGRLDLAIDGAGGEGLGKIIDILSYGGTFVSYGATLGSPGKLNMHRIFWRQLSLLGSTMGSDKDFASMLNFVNVSKITPVIDTVFGLDDVAEGFRRMNEGTQFGKIVIGV